VLVVEATPANHRDAVRVLVTGCAGYIGVLAAEELVRAGHEVRGLDVLLHGQRECVPALEALGVEMIEGDVRDPAARAAALAGANAVVHLAAIVGDPACALDPRLSTETNVDASKALAAEAATRGVGRFVMASTCSNYGRMADPTVPIDESGGLAPVSVYAEQKVALEEYLLAQDPPSFALTCLRFATVYGVAPRMRFDLTVNEFTRDLWAGRTLEVFGERFWRPYVHVRDAARAITATVNAPEERVAGQVFNVGDSAENYRKVDLVEEIRRFVDGGTVVFVSRDEDPRDYKVSFDKISTTLGFTVTTKVPEGVVEIVGALAAGAYPEPFGTQYRNSP
jgi:nucleoside-diphosphate-sugar epimerase